MKQQRKNKTNQSVTWPTTTYFTIAELAKLNPKMLTVSGSDITLRVRLTKAIEGGKIAELGSLPGGKGRPVKVFALTPITQLAIDKAKANQINLVDNWQRLVNVISVSPTPTAQPTANAAQTPVAATH